MNFFNKELLTEEYLKKAGKTIITIAIIELILSLIMLFAPLLGVTIVVYFLAAVLLIAGFTKVSYTFKQELSTGKKILGYILAFLYIVAGVMSIFHILVTYAYLSLMIGFLLVFQGISSLFTASSSPAKGLQIFNGIITLILGGAILINYPASIVLVTLFIGLSLLSNAITLFVAYYAVKKYKNSEEQSNSVVGDESADDVNNESTNEVNEQSIDEATSEGVSDSEVKSEEVVDEQPE